MRVLASAVLSVLAVGMLMLSGARPAAAAEIQPSSKLLVPWFEVDLNDPAVGLTTLFAVCNHDPGAIEVLAPSFITQHVQAPSGGAALQAWCLPYDAQPPARPAASLSIEARVQGLDADVPPGPELSVTTRYLLFTYEVANTGEAPLLEVAVTDSRWVGIRCDSTRLAPGESMTCQSVGAAIVFPGQYSAVGTVTGMTPWGRTVSALDPIYYFGVP